MNRLKEVFVTGTFDFEKGCVSGLEIPVSTSAFKLAMEGKALDERTGGVKVIINSNN